MVAPATSAKVLFLGNYVLQIVRNDAGTIAIEGDTDQFPVARNEDGEFKMAAEKVCFDPY